MHIGHIGIADCVRRHGGAGHVGIFQREVADVRAGDDAEQADRKAFRLVDCQVGDLMALAVERTGKRVLRRRNHLFFLGLAGGDEGADGLPFLPFQVDIGSQDIIAGQVVVDRGQFFGRGDFSYLRAFRGGFIFLPEVFAHEQGNARFHLFLRVILVDSAGQPVGIRTVGEVADAFPVRAVAEFHMVCIGDGIIREGEVCVVARVGVIRYVNMHLRTRVHTHIGHGRILEEAVGVAEYFLTFRIRAGNLAVVHGHLLQAVLQGTVEDRRGGIGSVSVDRGLALQGAHEALGHGRVGALRGFSVRDELADVLHPAVLVFFFGKFREQVDIGAVQLLRHPAFRQSGNGHHGTHTQGKNQAQEFFHLFHPPFLVIHI